MITDKVLSENRRDTDKPYRIVSFFTPQYKAEAEGFTANLREWGMKYLVLGVACQGSWRLNCGMKAHFMQAMQHLYPTERLVWIDVDGRLHADPVLFEALAGDFGAYFITNVQNIHRPHGPKSGLDGVASGTMFFNSTPDAKTLVDEWVRREDADPKYDYEQMLLGEVVHDLERTDDIVVDRLPQRYCRVFDAKWVEQPSKVVVMHYQASRKHRRAIG